MAQPTRSSVSPKTARIFLVLAILAIGFLAWTMWPSGGSAPAVPSQAQPREEMKTLDVAATDFGGDWPLTVASGQLRCFNQVVTFVSGATTYAVNGAAKQLGTYTDIASIWADDPSGTGLKKDIGPLIDRGLKLCD